MDHVLRVFIAEDEAIILRSFISAVEKMGHTVAGFALDGVEASRKIQELNPDLVLIDINMPAKDGLTVIRESCSQQMIPVIIITGYFSDKLVERANQDCVFAYLMKPVNNQQLEAAINVAWSKYRQWLATTQQAKDLHIALEDRKKIERAKGILMDCFALKESEAMARLQKMSREKNKKLAVIAAEIIDAQKKLLQ